MDPRNIKADHSMEIWFILSDPIPALVCGLVQLEYMGSRGYALYQGKKKCMARLREPEKAEELDSYLTRSGAQLAFLSSVTGNAEVMLTLFFFGMPVLEMETLTVAVDGALLKKRPLDAIYRDCVFKIDGEEYFQIWPHEEESGSFAIVGETLTLPMEIESTAGGKIFFLNRIANAPDSSVGGIRLARGKLDLRDRDNAEVVRSIAAGQLEALLGQEGSYLSTWDTYCAEEGAFLLEKAREIGALRYVSVERNERGYRFFLADELAVPLAIGTSLRMQPEKPQYIENPEMTFDAYLDLEEQNFRQGKRNGQNCSGSVLLAKAGSIDIGMDAREMYPPAQGYLTLSLAGDMIQMQRKFKARRAVRECWSANPVLGILIEENGVLPPARGKKTPEPALSPAIRDKIFSHPPTLMQEKAVEIAINTPDIAIIQGPPGTGKTTVIAAIVERLNEMLDPHASSAAILLSSYQHDAVDNMVNKIHVNSLPTLKFGSRRGASDDASRVGITRWQKELTSRLRQKYPQLDVSERGRELRQDFLAYMANPGDETEKIFLEQVLKLPASWRDAKIEREVEQRLDVLHQGNVGPDRMALRAYVYALRQTPETYADDGLFTAARAVIPLADFLEAEDKELLMQTPKTFTGGEEEYFRRISLLKEQVLDKLTPDLLTHRPYPRQEIVAMMGRIEEKMRDANAQSGQEEILSDFMYELENNPEAVDKALSEFNVVYASTAQQAEGKAISAAKKRLHAGGKGRAVVYDTVIIDEAARCSPMDMLIPMSQGARRIILVGDHKQLPHIVEDGIIERMECGKAEKNLLKESMFEYLIRRAKTLSARDQQPRFVTLDAQYRMHPVLGDLVSRAFYGGVLKSPLGAEYFQQDLPDVAGLPAAWFHIPHFLGHAEKPSTSWQRPVEAREIARLLQRWFAAKESRGLSFGVITFYRAQKDMLLQMAKEEGLLMEDETGGIVLRPEYTDDTVAEKLRINTVDAFQGKEFDIVLLSMVRSTRPGKTEYYRESDRTLAGIRRFGHLCLPNRLCVALSRQKRFLGIVGDMAMLEDVDSRQSVPPLAEFLDICRDAASIIDCGGAP